MAKVLLVSSGEAYHRGIGLALQSHDLDVSSCSSDLSEVAEATASGRPDVVVIASGPDREEVERVAGAVRSAAPSVPVMVLAHPDMGTGARWAFEAGAAGYMLPSVTLEEVVRAVKTLAVSPPDPEVLRRNVVGKLSQGAGIRAKLSDRQREIMKCLSRGLSDREIAKVLCVSGSTVHREISVLLQMMGASNRTELAALSVRLGFVGEPGRGWTPGQ